MLNFSSGRYNHSPYTESPHLGPSFEAPHLSSSMEEPLLCPPTGSFELCRSTECSNLDPSTELSQLISSTELSCLGPSTKPLHLDTYMQAPHLSPSMKESHFRPPPERFELSASTECSNLGLSAELSDPSSSTESSNPSSSIEPSHLDPPTEPLQRQKLITGPAAKRKGRPPVSLANHRDEKRGAAFYVAHSAHKNMTVETIRLGFWATNKDMGQLWETLEASLQARDLLFFNKSRIVAHVGALAALKAKRLEAVDASIERLEHFKDMMTIVDKYPDYKTNMRNKLVAHCMMRWSQRKRNKPPGTLVPDAVKKSTQGLTPLLSTTAFRSAPTKTGTQVPATSRKELSGPPLGSQTISIAINGIADVITYLPLHRVPADNPLKMLDLPNDEMKPKLQPEDLSFDLLKTLVSQDRTLDGTISVTSPELGISIMNERVFQTVVHILLVKGSKLEFMICDSNLVCPSSQAILYTLMR